VGGVLGASLLPGGKALGWFRDSFYGKMKILLACFRKI